MRLHALLVLLPSALAFQIQFPFKVSELFSSKTLSTHVEEADISTTHRVAIIGAGAGGSSAAFWISKAKERFGLDVEIDVYEQSDYIGGRSTIVYPYNDSSLPELELGASIFVEANKNLWRASDEFNLTRRNFREENYETGIWDGEELLFSFTGGWWDTAKLIWRYGIFSPKRVDAYVASMIKQILLLYSSASPKWDNITNLSTHLGWTENLNSTTAEYLAKQGVSEKYTNEVVEAATRVNYGQNVRSLHALEGAVSMAGTGANGIAGGNFQLFEQFLNRSGANVYLNTPVSSIAQKSSTSHLWSVKSARGTLNYKAVILAAPFHSAGIAVPESISEQVKPQPYIHLHVTLLATTAPTPNPEYFSLPPTSPAPRMVLTTTQGGKNTPEFNSLSYHGLVREGEWAVKIFSAERISDEWLSNMFQGKVGWVLRKEWDAYTENPPTLEFPPVKLDTGFYYVNSFEPFISTMETETVSSRNIVELMLNDEFNSSICGRTISESNENVSDDSQQPTTANDSPNFVFGWDC
ncbi:FAD/NAD(P)-binding domain-containing protein [Pholiota conissans]|uniref:FAD/NAD(P)-binding domain-containing protein n=1 Tax=Pholiota conissans TaxID=109636 RepID=A0A9P6CTT2_9AGAR|nr:FAD/NAD(P)-binding domain-containing protein [Pholiota conissans]